MTHIYKSPFSCEYDRARGGARYVNVWKRGNEPGLHAGDRHWSRVMADKNQTRNLNPEYKVLYRVVVKFKVMKK